MKKQKLLIISSLLLFSQVSACDQNNISTSLTQKEVSNISLVSLPTKLINTLELLNIKFETVFN